MPADAVVTQMQSLILRWEESSDQRAIFLKCYLMMTRNMRKAIQQGEFRDPRWVNQLLDRFANYYFVALAAYEQDPAAAPAVWQLAHQATQDPRMSALQNLLLGVNAHINYDLVLTLVDMLRPEWVELSDAQRAARYADHCRVNEVIGHTIDAVQDQVLEPAMPVLDIVDQLLGPLDEKLVSSVLRGWRENVWRNAVRFLETQDEDGQRRLVQVCELEAIQVGEMIGLKGFHRGRVEDATQ